MLLLQEPVAHEHDTWWHCVLDWITTIDVWKLLIVLVFVGVMAWTFRNRIPFLKRTKKP